jgi:protein tyrosine phosphatase (PTP) superfamily phosphohydrolase (DUF442 family)
MSARIMMICVVVLASLQVMAADSGTNSAAAPARIGTNQWAAALTRPGLPNLHKVSDMLYRGAQPTAEGFPELRKMGIKTVVCLRNFHSDKKLMGTNGLAYVAIPMNTWHAETKDVVKFIKVVTDTNMTPVFVHCQHGADRTGAMCAMYRIVVCGWSKEDALKEMQEGGFGFHEVWQNLLKFIDKIDVDKVKAETGLAPTGATGTTCSAQTQPGNAKGSLVKRVTKAAAEAALNAVDGVGEAVNEHGKKTAETVTRAAGEVAAGVAEGAKTTMEKNGAAIGSNLVSAAAPVVAGAVEEGIRQSQSPAFSNLDQRLSTQVQTNASGK